MKVLLDTNILGRCSQPTHPHHQAVLRALARLRRGQHELYLVPQVLHEFWVVATRPVDVNGLGLSPEATEEWVEHFLRLYVLLVEDRGIFERWYDTARRYRCVGKVAHDARLVAAAEAHGLTHLLTWDGGHFTRFTGLQLLEPQSVAAEGS